MIERSKGATLTRSGGNTRRRSRSKGSFLLALSNFIRK